MFPISECFVYDNVDEDELIILDVFNWIITSVFNQLFNVRLLKLNYRGRLSNFISSWDYFLIDNKII